MKTATIIIDKRTGTTRFLYDDHLASLLTEGEATVTRASHVEPTDDLRWTADLSPCHGPVLGPFATRAEALAAEAEWLLARHLPRPEGA